MGKQYPSYVTSGNNQSVGQTIITKTPAMTPLNPNQTMNNSFNGLFNNIKSMVSIPSLQAFSKAEPVEYIDDNLPISVVDKNIDFKYGKELDIVLDTIGGVSEIIECNWSSVDDQGIVICLLKDWRIFRYFLDAKSLDNLDEQKRLSKIEAECQIFEDMDDWTHWEDSGGKRFELDKAAILERKKEEEELKLKAGYNDALNDFFNGNMDNMKKIIVGSGSGEPEVNLL